MTAIEPRVAQRRQAVSEDRARRRLRRLLGVIAVLALVGAVAWLVRSPLLSVQTVEVRGAEHAAPAAIVASLGEGIGTPMIDISESAIVQAIEADPWVADASVERHWPSTLAVTVVEHEPVVALKTGTGYVMLSAAASVVDVIDRPGASALVIDIPVTVAEPGSQIGDPMVTGAVAFARALRSDLQEGGRVYVKDDGLFATVSGHDVRLGRPAEMETKAAVLAALIDDGISPGAQVDLIAPLRPAVTNPQPQVETEQ